MDISRCLTVYALICITIDFNVTSSDRALLSILIQDVLRSFKIVFYYYNILNTNVDFIKAPSSFLEEKILVSVFGDVYYCAPSSGPMWQISSQILCNWMVFQLCEFSHGSLRNLILKICSHTGSS